jgi:hypothetical protein
MWKDGALWITLVVAAAALGPGLQRSWDGLVAAIAPDWAPVGPP